MVMSGPIDPLDRRTINDIGKHPGTLEDKLLRVARAVCPEHHAVYDTRTHCLMNGAELADLYTLIDGDTDDMMESARIRLRAFFDRNEELTR